MKNRPAFEAVLNNITDCVGEYNTMTIKDGAKLLNLIRTLSANIFYLSEEFITFRSDYVTKVNELVEYHSVSESEYKALEEIPELEACEQTLKHARIVLDSMRSILSDLKTEKQLMNYEK